MADPVVQYQLVTGSWVHVAGDQLVRPDGVVRFEPDPSGLPPLSASTVGTVRALVAAGVLQDVQGRNGVYLAAYVDGVPIRWTATPENLRYDGTDIPTKPVTFDPNLDGVQITAL